MTRLWHADGATRPTVCRQAGIGAKLSRMPSRAELAEFEGAVVDDLVESPRLPSLF